MLVNGYIYQYWYTINNYQDWKTCFQHWYPPNITTLGDIFPMLVFTSNTNVGQLVSIRYSNIGKCISNIGIKLVNHCNIFSMSLVSLMSSPTLVNGCIFQYWYIIYESPTMKYMLPTLVYHIFQQWKYENWTWFLVQANLTEVWHVSQNKTFIWD